MKWQGCPCGQCSDFGSVEIFVIDISVNYRNSQKFLTQNKSTLRYIPYSRKLSRKKNIHEFQGLYIIMAICESFLHKIWERHIICCRTSKQSAKVFPMKILFSTNLRMFSRVKVSCHTVLSINCMGSNLALELSMMCIVEHLKYLSCNQNILTYMVVA